MRTEVYEVSTVLGLCTVLAVLDRSDRQRSECSRRPRRVLIVSINSRYPEVESWYRANPTISELLGDRFDRIVELNEEIFPVHPAHWRYERGWIGHHRRWLEFIGASQVDVLYLESVQAPPSWSLAQLFAEAELRIYSDGLMVYSPTRTRLPKDVLRRVTEVVYVDYLAGVTPLLLDEVEPQLTRLSIDELRTHFDALRPSMSRSNGEERPTAVFLGQAMANARMMGHEAEVSLYVRGLEELSKVFGVASVAFKPHTSAPSALTADVRRGFNAATGNELMVIDPRVPIESVIDRSHTAAVAGVFSTALFTVAQLFSIPAFAYGTKEVLHRLRPFENSNRIPLIAADIMLPSVRALVNTCAAVPDHDVATLARELATSAAGNTTEFRAAQIVVGYHMQPQLLEHRQKEAAELMSASGVRHLDLYLAGREDKPANRSRRIAKVVEETARWLARITLDERRARKLERNPERFFRDSRVPGATLAGRAYRRIVG